MGEPNLTELCQRLKAARTPWTHEPSTGSGRSVIRSAPPENAIVARDVEPEEAELIVTAVNQLPNVVETLDTRKLVDRAKGRLMDDHGLAESEAYSLIRQTAMTKRVSIGVIAQRVIAGEVPVPID